MTNFKSDENVELGFWSVEVMDHEGSRRYVESEFKEKTQSWQHQAHGLLNHCHDFLRLVQEEHESFQEMCNSTYMRHKISKSTFTSKLNDNCQKSKIVTFLP